MVIIGGIVQIRNLSLVRWTGVEQDNPSLMKSVFVKFPLYCHGQWDDTKYIKKITWGASLVYPFSCNHAFPLCPCVYLFIFLPFICIYLFGSAVPSCSMQDVCCCIWDLCWGTWDLAPAEQDWTRQPAFWSQESQLRDQLEILLLEFPIIG